MRVDAHAHLVPPGYRREVESRDVLPYPLPAWSEEQTHAFMDRHEIDAAIMSLAPPGIFFGDLGLARELARVVNEETAALVASAPGRFAGLAVLPLPDVPAALEELTHALDVLGLDGVTLPSNVGGTYPGCAAWAPVLDELDRRGTYVLLHPTAAAGPLPLPDHPVWLYEFPFDTTRAVVDLIYSGTLERCKRIRLQVAHLGGTAPFLAHRLGSLAARDPARAALAPAGVLAHLQRLFYDTGLSNDREPLAATRQLVPFEQIVFGTDWPYAALPDAGDPAPGLAGMDAVERSALDAVHVAALVPRLVG